MPYCLTANTISNRSTCRKAPLFMTLTIGTLESILAQVICFFDALERLIPPYAVLVTSVSIIWSITQYGFFTGLMFGVPLGLIMAFVHALAIVLAMFILGLVLWLTLIPIYLIASKYRWQLPTVLEQNPTVERWIHHWSRRTPTRRSADSPSPTRKFAGLMIGLLLGCWLLE